MTWYVGRLMAVERWLSPTVNLRISGTKYLQGCRHFALLGVCSSTTNDKYVISTQMDVFAWLSGNDATVEY